MFFIHYASFLAKRNDIYFLKAPHLWCIYLSQFWAEQWPVYFNKFSFIKYNCGLLAEVKINLIEVCCFFLSLFSYFHWVTCIWYKFARIALIRVSFERWQFFTGNSLEIPTVRIDVSAAVLEIWSWNKPRQRFASELEYKSPLSHRQKVSQEIYQLIFSRDQTLGKIGTEIVIDRKTNQQRWVFIKNLKGKVKTTRWLFIERKLH